MKLLPLLLAVFCQLAFTRGSPIAEAEADADADAEAQYPGDGIYGQPDNMNNIPMNSMPMGNIPMQMGGPGFGGQMMDPQFISTYDANNMGEYGTLQMPSGNNVYADYAPQMSSANPMPISYMPSATRPPAPLQGTRGYWPIQGSNCYNYCNFRLGRDICRPRCPPIPQPRPVPPPTYNPCIGRGCVFPCRQNNCFPYVGGYPYPYKGLPVWATTGGSQLMTQQYSQVQQSQVAGPDCASGTCSQSSAQQSYRPLIGVPAGPGQQQQQAVTLPADAVGLRDDVANNANN